MADSADVDVQYQIFSGKLRRYYGESWFRRITDVRTIVLNLRDMLFVGIGVVQSLYLLIKIRPDAIFLKGGFVVVPVGLVAALLKIPYVTHDSDALPGLANRIVGRWAAFHAVALSPETYPYTPAKTVQTGIVVSESFRPVREDQRKYYREAIGIPPDSQVLLVNGGSSGAAAINIAMVGAAPNLLEAYPRLYIIHQTGKGKASGYQTELLEQFGHRLRVVEFIDDLHEYSGASDVIICRAGANTLAEFGQQAKSCIVIPAPHLSGGHQLKNAEYLADRQAVIVVKESSIIENPQQLIAAVARLLEDEALRQGLGKKLSEVMPTNGVEGVVDLLEIVLGNKPSTDGSGRPNA
jgi:UDP-N-acetylglucosamine--N-acetylmuramyl-(pentapeptide) pyrophosphoryl-undecaprenol N-acetylglucosamine transferase